MPAETIAPLPAAVVTATGVLGWVGEHPMLTVILLFVGGQALAAIVTAVRKQSTPTPPKSEPIKIEPIKIILTLRRGPDDPKP